MESPTRAASSAKSKDPAEGLTAVAALRRLLDGLEALQVENARRHDWPWEKIALFLGVTKQAVHQKYAHRLRTKERKK